MATKAELITELEELRAKLAPSETEPIDLKTCFRNGAYKQLTDNLVIGKEPVPNDFEVRILDTNTNIIYRISKSCWVAIVAAVSVGGNNGENHSKVLKIHEGR